MARAANSGTPLGHRTSSNGEGTPKNSNSTHKVGTPRKDKDDSAKKGIEILKKNSQTRKEEGTKGIAILKKNAENKKKNGKKAIEMILNRQTQHAQAGGNY